MSHWRFLHIVLITIAVRVPLIIAMGDPPDLYKFLPIAGDVSILSLLYFIVHKAAGRKAALWSALHYSLNPAIIFCSVSWDGIIPLSRRDEFPGVISANAHNVWFLLSYGDSWRNDLNLVFGGITARASGFLVALFFTLLAVLRVRHRKGIGGLALAAYGAFAVFLFATGMEDNHLFPALLFAIAALAYSPHFSRIILILTITFLVNLVVHDPILAQLPHFSSLDIPLTGTINAAANLALFLMWTLFILVKGRVG